MADKKYVYFFGDGKAEGRGDMKDLLGGKGANLADMTSIDIYLLMLNMNIDYH